MTDLDRVVRSPGSAASALEVQAETPDAGKLRLLAAQFEALLLGQMLKEMRASMFDDEDKSTGFSGGPLNDQIFTELSTALSRAGGFGFAQAVTGPLARQAGVTASDLPADVQAFGLASVPAAFTAGASRSSTEIPSLELPGLDSARLMAGRISSSYGWRRDPLSGDVKFHKGADIAMPVGQDVPAARPGQVSFAGELPGYGLTVVVDHGDRMSTRYAHLSALSSGVGDTVRAGQVIGRSGATGRATGPHLHFEVLADGQPVDPTPWLAARGR